MDTTLLVLARSFHIGGAMLLFATLFFDQVTSRRAAAVTKDHAARWLLGLLLVELLSGAAWLFLATGQMVEADPWYAVSPADLATVLGQTHFGQLWIARAGIAAALAAALVIGIWRPHLLAQRAALLLSAALLISLAWAGHAGAGPDKLWQVPADGLHLLIGGIWPVGLFPLALYLRSARTAPPLLVHEVLTRFSRFSGGAVLLLTATGFINSWFLVGAWHHLVDTAYGRLLVGKLLAFGALIALGALNRYHFLARWKSTTTPPPLGPLRISVAIENLLALAILGFVGVLGMTEPPR